MIPELKALVEEGFEIFATPGTHEAFAKEGVVSRRLFKASAGRNPNVIDAILKREVDLIINIPRSNAASQVITDGYKVRRLAIDHNIPLITNLQIATLFLHCLAEPKKIAIKPWNAYIYGTSTLHR